jgi:CRP/FNR family transcriptional regulator, cyclic AMP receptor protein
MKQDTGFGVLTGNNIEAKTFKAGSTIFREGDEASELFVIKSGQVRVQIGNRTISELGTESIFGEMALIDSEPRRYRKSSSCFWSAKPPTSRSRSCASSRNG